LAVYRRNEFFQFFDYMIKNWGEIEEDALGPFFRNSSLEFCVEHYKSGNISKDLKFVIDTTLVSKCIYLHEDQLKPSTPARNGC